MVELAATLTSELSMVTAAVGVDGIDGEAAAWLGCGAGVMTASLSLAVPV